MFLKFAKKGTIKCRMLTGTYMLQSTSHTFSKANVSATCKCCGLYDEDLAHMLLECPAFIHQRKPIYSQFKTKVINCIGAQHWRELFNNRDGLVKLVLNCSRFSIISQPDKAIPNSNVVHMPLSHLYYNAAACKLFSSPQPDLPKCIH